MTVSKPYTGLSEVSPTLESLQRVVSEMKQSLEVYERQRGKVTDSFVRVQDLVDLGVLSPSQLAAFERGEQLASTELGGGKLRLVGAPLIFNFNASNVPNPTAQTAQFTAVTTDLDGPLTWTATAYDSTGAVQGNVSLEIAGTQASLSVTAFGGAEYVVVEVRQLGLYDRLTVSRSKEGAAGAPGQSAVMASMSRKTWALPTLQNGTVPSFVGADGMFRVYSGQTEVTSSATFTAVASSGCVGSINVLDDSPVVGKPRGYYQVSGLSVNNGTLTLTATYNGVTITDTFVVTKSYVGYEVVSSLPATDNYQGRVVFLTTDNKLYRWDNSSWTAAVPTGDLIGTIGTTQIQDGAISTPKLAANAVTAGKIDADAITSREILVGSLTGDRFQAGSITAAQIATGTITAASAIIADGAITSAKIGDLEVSSLKIQGNAVTTTKIAPGSVTSFAYNNLASFDLTDAYQPVIAAAMNFELASQPPAQVKVYADYKNLDLNVIAGRMGFWLRLYDNFAGGFMDTTPYTWIYDDIVGWATYYLTPAYVELVDQLVLRFFIPGTVIQNKFITFYVYGKDTNYAAHTVPVQLRNIEIEVLELRR